MRNFFDFNENYFVSEGLVGQCNAACLESVNFNEFDFLYKEDYNQNRCYY